MPIRIGIAGIAGRMGRAAGRGGHAPPAPTLAGGIERAGVGGARPPAYSPTSPRSVAAADVVIDFTHAVDRRSACRARWPRPATPWVLGTSGLSAADEAAVAAAAQRIAVVYAANFAPGVNLVLALAERMAAALPAEHYDAEIVEMHHRQKVDAPSGTAVGTRPRGGAGRGVGWSDVMRKRARRPHRRAQAPAPSASPRCAAARWSASTR